MKWLEENLTKILGVISTVITTLMTMIASGTFDGLLDPKDIRWLGIIGMLVSAATVGRGFNNMAKVRVAEAMKTAINATPGDIIEDKDVIAAMKPSTERTTP